MAKIKTPRKEAIENIDTNNIHDNPNKELMKARKALAKAKELEARTPTRAVISKDRKTVRFVKIRKEEQK